MRTINRVTVMGHLGADPILRYTRSGKAVANLSLATSQRRQDGPEETTWHRVVLWDKQAELAEKYLHKGNPIYVEGRLSERRWEDAEGQQRRSMELVASELVFLPKQGGAERAERPKGQLADGEEGAEISVEVPC